MLINRGVKLENDTFDYTYSSGKRLHSHTELLSTPNKCDNRHKEGRAKSCLTLLLLVVIPSQKYVVFLSGLLLEPDWRYM